MIQNKLENKIHNLIMVKLREPKIIIMHPKTWQDLVKEVTGSYLMAINVYDGDMKYKGIKVLRSLDLFENEFCLF